ncbi:integral membrane protein, putative [Theileria annulata]|uniref:Vesicle transport protein n=1 Tax=Theileria annulata TaxID=5874 RepID=Q4UBA2_THEAN|nr:integral membrane protein, putative [Theileria annulata]CAI75899.1 integral membrane protein, putative [Theileria annulata]|eukprot:XP_955375.1 integral membrane protein, putative [Theileria annulata]
MGDNSSLPIFSNKTEENFLLKGIDFGKTESNSGFKSRLSSAMNFGRNIFGLTNGWQAEPSWKTYTNYKAFLTLFACSVIFFVMSFMSLPFIIFAPYKFGLLFTLASLTFLSSMAFLRGAGSLIDHMLNPKRLVFTVSYLVSLLCTLVFTTFYPLYVFAFIFSLVQFFALSSVMISYIPGKIYCYTK